MIVFLQFDFRQLRPSFRPNILHPGALLSFRPKLVRVSSCFIASLIEMGLCARPEWNSDVRPLSDIRSMCFRFFFSHNHRNRILLYLFLPSVGSQHVDKFAPSCHVLCTILSDGPVASLARFFHTSAIVSCWMIFFMTAVYSSTSHNPEILFPYPLFHRRSTPLHHPARGFSRRILIDMVDVGCSSTHLYTEMPKVDRYILVHASFEILRSR